MDPQIVHNGNENHQTGTILEVQTLELATMICMDVLALVMTGWAQGLFQIGMIVVHKIDSVQEMGLPMAELHRIKADRYGSHQ
jgi:hypothetical protein